MYQHPWHTRIGNLNIFDTQYFLYLWWLYPCAFALFITFVFECNKLCLDSSCFSWDNIWLNVLCVLSFGACFCRVHGGFGCWTLLARNRCPRGKEWLIALCCSIEVALVLELHRSGLIWWYVCIKNLFPHWCLWLKRKSIIFLLNDYLSDGSSLVKQWGRSIHQSMNST